MARNLLFLVLSAFSALGSQNPAVPNESGAIVFVKGASFNEINDVGGIKGSAFYLYVPSELYNPAPMLTPVIYVYGNKPYHGTREAWAAVTAAGLDKIAEAEHAAVIMVNCVGDDWGDVDVKVFQAIQDYIFFSAGTVKLTYHNLQYAIGEGSGATFINNYLSQNCKRIAAVMTFGGEIGSPYPLYPLPAYIVSGSQKAVDFYLNINDGNLLLPTSGRIDPLRAEVKKGWVKQDLPDKATNVFKPNPVKKVIVSKKIATRLDADLIADCWNSLFRYTTRTCLTDNVWQYSSSVRTESEFTLVARPNYKAAGMAFIKKDGVNNGIWPNSANNYWYEFVPAAVQQSTANKDTTKYPLIFCLHGGGDHPVYEAEAVGWAQLCIDNNIIMVAPNAGGTAEQSKLIDYMIAKYPVDPSRIYVVGFSGGARGTLRLATDFPERFAAAAPMSCVIGPNFTDLAAKAAKISYDYDLPICVGSNGRETEGTNYDDQYVWFDLIKLIYDINEIPQYTGKLDYEANPFWGFPIDHEKRFRIPAGFAIWRGFKSDMNNIPMVAFVHTELTTHTHYSGYAPLVWDYFKQFSRDTTTKKVIYKANQ